MHVEDGEPKDQGRGWYQIGETGGSEMVFFYYSEIWISAPPGADPDTACRRGHLKPPVGGYTIKVTYDNDGSVLHNASYTDDYWYGPWYSNKTPSERWVFCGSPRITVKPPSGRSKFPAGTYTLSYGWGSTPIGQMERAATVTVSQEETPPVPGPTRQYTGQWATSNEHNWGLTVLMNFPSNARYIFVPWYIYDTSGNPSWYIFQGDNWSANDTISLDVYRYRGSPWGVMPYDNTETNKPPKVGTATLTFRSATTATFQYNVEGASRTVNLDKLDGDSGTLGQYTGQWAKHGENAWGLTVLQNFHNSNYFFVPWYIYDVSGNAIWYLFQGNRSAINTFSAEVCRYRGSPWGLMPYDNSYATGCTVVGNAMLTFTSSLDATFTYNVEGASRTVELRKLQ